MASAPPVQEQHLQPGTKHFRNQLAAAVRSIGWSYAIFWSISTSRPDQVVLAWKDGFYNGEVKTRKISNSEELTAEQVILQRSEQLRELYCSLLSGECDHRARRPMAALSPEDLGDAEWYYVICMTYIFRPGQGLPGKSFASNAPVWLYNAQSADTNTFLRALLAKSASIQTIVCIPFMSGVLELGTTDLVSEDPNLVNQIVASFQEPPFPTFLEVPTTVPPPDEMEDADGVFEGFIDHDAIEQEQTVVVVPQGEHEIAANDDLDQVTMETDELYSLYEELDLDVVRFLEDTAGLPVDPGRSFQLVPTSSSLEAAAAANDDGDAVDDGVVNSRASCFVAWKRASCSDEAVDAVPVTGVEPQKLLKKAVDGGAWMGSNDGDGRDGRGAIMAQESSIKNHVMSERRRREKLNEMFLILKSLVPSVRKVDKASILAETIAYLKELEKRVKELESSREASTRQQRRRREIAGGKACVVGGGDTGRKQHRVVTSQQEGAPTANVDVTVAGKVVVLDVQCRWKELVMTRVFDAIKSLSLDILSVQASAPDGLLRLKIQAKFACSGTVAPGMISEELQKAIGSYC
ncbi:anthocyanin regulatory R-S protein-like isoform X2 [Oryza brachyantha]|uniref:anthocyanin regulatory R-S protein-like isoform X2 n=1 Tax=Oryza brachyantha TaxID=4533 RepID=UPI001ADBC19C|nr:anthocyanin regulatory R-S protein-like isoform X2 [Oryza brachyantha]